MTKLFWRQTVNSRKRLRQFWMGIFKSVFNPVNVIKPRLLPVSAEFHLPSFELAAKNRWLAGWVLFVVFLGSWISDTPLPILCVLVLFLSFLSAGSDCVVKEKLVRKKEGETSGSRLRKPLKYSSDILSFRTHRALCLQILADAHMVKYSLKLNV